MIRAARPTAILAFALLMACGAGAPLPTDRTSEPARSAAAEFAELAPDVYEPCGLAPSTHALWVLGCSANAVRIPSDGGTRVTRPLEGDILSLDGIAGDGGDEVWVVLSSRSGPARRGAVIGIDGSSGEKRTAVDLGPSIPTHAVWMGGRLWVSAVDGRLFTVEDSVAREVAAGAPLTWLVTDGSRLWTIAENGDVSERDTTSGGAVRTFSSVLPNSIAAAAGMGSVWLASADRGVLRLDPKTGLAGRLQVAPAVNDVEACGGAMWLSQPDLGLTSVDATGSTIRSIRLPVAPRYLLCDGTRLWILSEDGRLGSIDVTA